MGNEGEKNASARRNQTPFWNLGWVLESGSHPLAYLQAPVVSSRRLPRLRSFRSSGHKDPEQPGACVPQSARNKRFSWLTKWEKGQRRATRMLVKIQFLGTSVPEGSDSSSVLLPSSFSWQSVTQAPGSPWQPLLFCSAWSLQSPPPLPHCAPRYPLTTQRGGLAETAQGEENGLNG